MRVLNGWTDSAWDDELRTQPEATIFHTRRWADLCCRSFPQLRDRSVWLEVTTSEGSSRHLLPLLEWRRGRGLVTTIQSSFPFVYGGPLPARGAGGLPILGEVLDFLSHRRGSILLTSNPIAQAEAARRKEDRDVAPTPAAGADPAPIAPGWERTLLHTHLRTLPPQEEDFWDGELAPRRRNDVRRLTKKGVLIEESRSERDVAAVHRLYRQSFRRWGGEPAFVHPEAFYQNLLAMGEDHVRFTVARYERAVIGGVFALRFGRIVHYLAGYMDTEAKSLRPNVLLQVDSIRAAIRHGYELYDFLPSGGNESVEQFKEGFGGIRSLVPVWNRRSWVHRLLAHARRR